MEVQIRRHSAQSPWSYADLDSYQRSIAQRNEEALLLNELAPVITLGRRAVESDLLFSVDQLNRLGITVYPTDRGGLATYHGPGQWVLFPVMHFRTLTGDSRGVRLAVEGLLEVAQSVATRYDTT